MTEEERAELAAKLGPLTAPELRAMGREATRRYRKAARRSHAQPIWKRGPSSKAVREAQNRAVDVAFYDLLAAPLEQVDRGRPNAPRASVGHTLSLQDIERAHTAAVKAARAAPPS